MSSNTKCLVKAGVQDDLIHGDYDFICAAIDAPNVIAKDYFDSIARPPIWIRVVRT